MPFSTAGGQDRSNWTNQEVPLYFVGGNSFWQEFTAFFLMKRLGFFYCALLENARFSIGSREQQGQNPVCSRLIMFLNQ